MGEKIVVGPINKGLRTGVTPFNIDNDSFPTLINAYQWRGRLKRKRGTSLLGRLQRFLGTTDGAGNIIVTISPTPIIAGIVSFTVGTDIFVDAGGASPVTLTTNGAATVHTLNRTTGVLTINGSLPNTSVIYFPSLPAMGLEDLILTVNQFPGCLAFDTKYSYEITTNEPHVIYDISFYKNPGASASLPGYAPKGTWTPTSWNGQDYQQFQTVNYQGALWATNGINIPFSTTNIGMQFKPITNVAIVAGGPPAIVTLTIAAHGLVPGDFVFLNEILGNTGINFQTGYVVSVGGVNTVNVELPNATIAGAYSSGGIAQYLTTRSDTTVDCLRWYDGDPVTSATPPVFQTGDGWVNFAPPISQSSLFSIGDLPAAQYYLVGCRIIIPFKDRLLFIGPIVQTSSAGSQVYLQDTIVYSQNGTPYYTCSFTAPTGYPFNPTGSGYSPILVPINQTATPSAYFSDSTGFGGFITAGIDQKINTANKNGDVIVIGFDSEQSRLVYTGNDIIPFNFYTINSELGSSSTFSTINMDEGVLTRGSRGYVMTSQTQAKRFDLEIPDEVFEINLTNNGSERFTAQRDFINEWIYFSYPANTPEDDDVEVNNKFNNQTLLFNYRDESFAIFNESYTTYGQFRIRSGYTWATIGTKFKSWSEWNEPWNAGSTTLDNPLVIAGNQQGFIFFRDDGTNESTSLVVQSISGNTITSPNHGLNQGDYIILSSSISAFSDTIFQVGDVTLNTFIVEGAPAFSVGIFITRMYVPQIQSKQFPVSWGLGRKTRIGTQQYLLTTTSSSQITLQIFLSQNADSPYTSNIIVPDINSPNNSLIYSQILFTCPESTNLGLTPANTNLQMPTAAQQSQIWHRINTSLIGDTVQVGFTLSDDQMRDVNFLNQFAEIEIHSFILDISASMMLS